MSTSRKQEFHNLAGSGPNFHGPAPGHAGRTYSYHPVASGETMAALASSLAGFSMQGNNYQTHSKGPRNGSDYPYAPAALQIPGTGPVAYPAHYAALAPSGPHGPSGVFHPQMAYVQPHSNYHNYVAAAAAAAAAAAESNQMSHSHGWSSRGASGEMPAMVTPRRDSVSSNEQDVPGTPYTSFGNGGISVFDRSPSGVYTQSGTPSPSNIPFQTHGSKSTPTAPAVPLAIQLLIQKEPAIPRAIPAPSSPAKPLDRSLENKNGETNVYIRGLHPETTDEMLQQWGHRFGEIQSSKSIIDMKTNLCKGFGFIKYFNYNDAEQCIRGFHFLGYEVSFARESFYAKLKKFSDESNTNLYVSDIPRSMNEHELSEVFKPHVVVSCRILRDPQGNGRGVGFARFESREICEEIVRTFNNTVIKKPGIEEHVIQIRYSDTHEQKVLKQQTAAARQFRAAEFEFGVMQARSTGTLPVIQSSPSPRESRKVASTSEATTAVADSTDAEKTAASSPKEAAVVKVEPTVSLTPDTKLAEKTASQPSGDTK